MPGGKFLLYLSLGFCSGCLVYSYGLAAFVLVIWIFVLAGYYKFFKAKIFLIIIIIILGSGLAFYSCYREVGKRALAVSMWKNSYGKNVKLTGNICAEPDRRQDQQKLTVCTNNGKVLATAALYPEYYFGDTLEISGQLKRPGVIKNFNYENYLALSKVHALIYYPGIKKISSVGTSSWRSFLLGAKGKAKIAFSSGLPEPEAGLAEALVLGYKNTVPDEELADFSKSGLSHLIAISGSHITTLSGGLFYLWLLLYGSRRNFLPFFIVTISAYIWLSGGAAAAWRAALMGFGSVLAISFGRPFKILPWLAYSAAILLIVQPFAMRDDPGWQLSFLALLGVLILFPVFTDNKKDNNFVSEKIKKGSRISGYLKENFWLTISSQLITLPLTCNSFGGIPLLAPLANCAIAWIFNPLFLYLLIMVFPAMIFFNFSSIFLLPAWPALYLFYKVGEAAARFDIFYMSVSSWPAYLSVLYYGFLAWRIFKFWYQKTRE